MNNPKPYEKIGMSPPSPWMPCTDPITIAVLGKLQEELAEASKEVARCLIMGPYAIGPGKSKPNIELLRKELADIAAIRQLMHEEFHVPPEEMQMLEVRTLGKIVHKREWLQLIRDNIREGQFASDEDED